MSMQQTQIHSNLKEFAKTLVILAPVREFSRLRAALKRQFPGVKPGEFHFFILGVNIGVCVSALFKQSNMDTCYIFAVKAGTCASVYFGKGHKTIGSIF